MLKFSLLLLFLCSLAQGARLSLDERRKEILRIVDEELSEVNRLAESEDYKSPDTLLRKSELNLEKARLWREAENEKYLAIPPEERVRISKKDYFKQSTVYFEAANDAAELVVKKFPRYKGIGEVYYILAYNNKELGNNDTAKKYFRLSTETSGSNSPVLNKSKLALADYYFNDHKYKEAIPLYEAAVKKSDDKWWTKDAFNLAWSYYRSKEYDKAISLMREVHRKSADGKYVDMRNLVERDLGVFYVDAGRMNDAIKFYEGLGLNYTEQFVKIANVIITQGRFAQAEALLSQAAKNEKDRGRRIQILMSELDLFDKYNKTEEHLQVAKELVALHKESPLPEEDLKRLSYHVNKQAAELQKATASDLYANVPKVKSEKSREAIAYFELAGQLAPNLKSEKTFFQAETAYAATQFGKATSLYIKAFDEARTADNRKVQSQSLEGMLSALAQPGLPKEDAEKYYAPVYSRYLTADSKSERANQIFVKLFNTQFDSGNVPGAEETMASFAKNFPADFKTQEAMLAKVMEHYRNKKDYGKVKEYVGAINDGKFKVSSKYAEALRALMTKIQIEGVQQSLEKGDKATALKGYHQIYNNAESTPKAKTNAAYNLSALYYEMGDTNQSYQWGVVALKDMEVDDVNKLGDSFLGISAGLFLRQSFNQSADLSYRILAKLCKQSSQNKVAAYKNAVFISLANGDLDKALEIKEFGRNCTIPDQTEAEVGLELLKELGKAKRWEAYERTLAELDKNPKNHALLIRPYEDLRREFISVGQAEEARSIEAKQQRYFHEAKQAKVDVPVDALDLISEKFMTGVAEKKKRLDQIQLRFPEQEFNTAVKAKLQLLDQMTTDVNSIQKVGSGKGIVEAYMYAISAYESFGEDLRKFQPEGKSPEYVSSFQKAMAEVYQPILTNARKQRNEIKKLITENKILSLSNYSVLYSPVENFKRYVTVKEAVLMDRGGKK